MVQSVCRYRDTFKSTPTIDARTGTLSASFTQGLDRRRVISTVWNVTLSTDSDSKSSLLPIHVLPPPCYNVQGRGCSPEGVYSGDCDRDIRWEFPVRILLTGLPFRSNTEELATFTVRVCILDALGDSFPLPAFPFERAHSSISQLATLTSWP